MLGLVPPELWEIMPSLYMDILPLASLALSVAVAFLEKGNLLAYDKGRARRRFISTCNSNQDLEWERE